MIQANELRIGNLVEYNGEVVNIVGITEEHPFINMITIDYLEYEEIRPIPLTKEIFKSIENQLVKKGFSYSFYDGKITLYLSDVLELKSEYLHLLQNLYFALTNTELTYENI